MGAESLFTSQTPVSTNQSDGGAAGIGTATGVYFAVPGYVTGIRWFTTTTITAGDTYTLEFWNVATATRIANTTVLGSTLTAGAWNFKPFTIPVAVAANTAYRALSHNNHNQGRYVATTNFFTAAGLVNGNITAWRHNTNPLGIGNLNNGTFTLNSAANVNPTFGNGACYFVDVVFQTHTTAGDFFPFFR